ncbi:hypothetical protein ABE67_14035 [Cytobacillus firmus]|uniref:CHC2 zinc finger domain-containing protein n=1 Tax=Cytobacillus firmus TaxID=1399 RepID=UPI0018CD7E31|nr:CHC2 zinc finger domain-containing protein [Cytobacillus firmus]MBG9450415.1 hypothetical protein [Cytobacillus firmus]
MSFICNEIRKNISIIEALEEYTTVDLSKSRIEKQHFNIRCPFHLDKSPSLTINTDTNSWYCWAGCGYGDIINHVSKAMNISNKLAIKLLAYDLGISNFNTQRIDIRQKAVKDFNIYCKDITENLKRKEYSLREIVANITTTTELEEIGEVYHDIAKLMYLSSLFKSDSIEDKIYAAKKTREITSHVNFKY